MSPILDDDFVSYTLNSLPYDFDMFSISIRVWETTFTSDEVHNLPLWRNHATRYTCLSEV